MDGTVADCIVIPIVVVISLAAWLILVYRADAHPMRRRPPGEAAATRVPAPRAEAKPAEAVPAETVPKAEGRLARSQGR